MKISAFFNWDAIRSASLCALTFTLLLPSLVTSQEPGSAFGRTTSLPQSTPRNSTSNTQQKLTPVQMENLISYLNSTDRPKKIRALEYSRQVAPTDALMKQVKTLAEHGEDAIVQGHARLLAADWGVSIDRQPVELSLNDLEFADPSGQRSDSLPIETELMPDQQPTAVRNPDRTDGARLNLTQQFDQNKIDSNFDFSAATENHTIGNTLADSQIGQQWSPVKQSIHESTPRTRVAANTLFEVPGPFWDQSAAAKGSLPADVEQHESLPELELEPETGIAPVGVSFKQAASRIGAQLPADTNDIRPEILDREIDASSDPALRPRDQGVSGVSYFQYATEAPLGFAGKSGVLPTEFQQSDHFVPIEDRWRIGFPRWDRYGKGHPVLDDYPFKEGSLLDPYNQNVLKGDYPIIGQHIFYNLTVDALVVHEYRQTPTATTPFESTNDPFSGGFFGSPDQFFYTPSLRLSFELFHGNAAFKPTDWRVRFVPILNFNFLDVDELAIVNPDVRRGTDRSREDAALEEWFLEGKLADIGPDYDFISTRVGSQFFVSDFRGFVFRDINRGVRLFGTRFSNRDQFNALWFDQAEKDTNSELNTFRDRHQNVVVFNYFRQDFVFPGYVAQASFHYNQDKPSFTFDDNDNLVRPDPVGVFKPHEVDAYYIGFAGEGHIGRINVSNQLYFVLGEDSANPIAGREQDINAQMAALELSYDRDWIRFRTSYFFASGDGDPNDGQANGFDTILDAPVFAGGEFSYWQRQSIRLFGTNLVQRKSLVPNLRSSKIQGQSNFVNPGLHLMNFGSDIELAPKTRAIANANYLFFDQTEVLETYTFQNKIDPAIGADLSLGIEHRPLLNDNAIIIFGIATLIPSQGLKDLFGTEIPDELGEIGIGNEIQNEIPRLTSAFVEVVLAY